MKLFQKQKFDEMLLHCLKPNILKRMSFQQSKSCRARKMTINSCKFFYLELPAGFLVLDAVG